MYEVAVGATQTAVALSWYIGAALAVAILGYPVEVACRALKRVAVTYVHTYRGSKVDGRRRAGFGRLRQSAGAHRARVA